jgi:3-hydroxyethyl bacteriochlorophyllide a dehydrogenase
LISRLAPGGEVILAGFYSRPVAFTFPPAFMREARLRVAAEFRDADVAVVTRLLESGALSLDDLITHRCDAVDAQSAYRAAFEDPACLKMVLTWRGSPDDR